MSGVSARVGTPAHSKFGDYIVSRRRNEWSNRNTHYSKAHTRLHHSNPFPGHMRNREGPHQLSTNNRLGQHGINHNQGDRCH